MLSSVRLASKRYIIVVGLIVAILGGCFVVVRAIDSSPWQNAGGPTIQKIVDLQPNTFPSTSNLECTESTVRQYLSNTNYNECLVMSAVGQAGSGGVIFNGASEIVPVVPPRPFEGLQPVPNQGMFVTTTSSSIIGTYLHFYRSIVDKLPLVAQNGQLKLTAPPDFTLRDANGTALSTNVYATAYSPSGSWMVVDIPWKGLVRINMATFEILAFAPSIQPVNDYSNITAQLSISNDGNNVVVKPSNSDSLNVYNLKNCSGGTMPIQASAFPCPVRNYWNEVKSRITGSNGIYQPRFVNETQISFKAVYDYVPGNFKVASYTMTAPGVAPTGIDYLGMGDSFASGEGAFSYVAGTDTDDNTCHLSSKSYAFLLSSQLFSSGHAVSCSGAQTSDIKNEPTNYSGQTVLKLEKKDRDPQFIKNVMADFTPGYLVQSEFIDTYKPEAVTLSIGGNNIGFSDILSACVSPFSQPKACYPTYEDRLELNNKVNGVFNELVATYKAVLKPGKRVYVVGYPQIVGSGDCALNVHFETSEIEMATDFINYMNDTIHRAADKAGVRYVDVTDAFEGHKMCEAPSEQVAVNGLTAGTDHGFGPIKVVGRESYHPNALGHELLARAIRMQTNNLTQPMPTADSSLQAPALPGSLDARNLPKTGRTPSNLVFDDGMSPDLLIRGQQFTVRQDSALKPNASYTVSMGGIQIGTATASNTGALTLSTQSPATIDAGFQTIHITGVNLLGQPLDVTKTVYVAASAGDYDGDGITDSSDSCQFAQNSGTDSDYDGIDDVCDPLIGTTPPPKLSGLKASVTLTQNSITLVKP